MSISPILLPFLLFLSYSSLLVSVSAIPGPFFVLQGSSLISERLDPILSPGGVSAHVHNIYGANKISASWEYDTVRTSTCNSMGLKVDNSNYVCALFFFSWRQNVVYV